MKEGSQALLLADAHIPLDDRPGARESRESFLELLTAEGKSSGLILLLGDIFDFWYEWDHVVPKRAFRILSALHQFILEGREIHYFAGNHDFRIHGFLQHEVGLILHQDEWICQMNGKEVYIHHGDGWAKGDHGYRFIKRIMRNRSVQALFQRGLHPDLAMLLGKKTSMGGRKRYDHLPHGKPSDEDYMKKAEQIIRIGFDLVISGHTHWQRLVKLEGGWYHNPGAFLHDRCYSVIRDNLPEGRIWKP